MRQSNTWLLVLLGALLVTGELNAQSLWQKGKQNHVALIADNRAKKVGDIITIVVDEQQDVSNKENVKHEKTSNAKAEVPKFEPNQDLMDDFFPIEWDYEREFEGKADFNKKGKFQTLLTATVTGIQPNGNLVIEGRRKVVLDGEEKWMTVSGVVRAYDVQSNNTVNSSHVANAKVTYESCGPMARTTSAGWLEKLLDFLWPF